MTVLCRKEHVQHLGSLSRTEPQPHSAPLRVEREHIEFFNVTPQRVHIQVTVHNDGTAWSQPVPMHLQAAAFGVFLPWRFLTTLQVPSIEAGGFITVHTEVEQAVLERLTAPAGPPQRPWLRAPAGSADGRPEEDAFSNVPRAVRALLRKQAAMGGWLPGIDIDPMTGRSCHWIGNINVFINRQAVERHMARALRVYPGRKNQAMFCVGGGERYAFSVHGEPLVDYTTLRSCGRPLILDQWTRFRNPAFAQVDLEVDIPDYVREGELAVRVVQQSTGAEAVVEFSLDADAQGPGCYVV